MAKKKISIGRDPQSDIVIDERWDTVSNEHAYIEERDGKLTFFDHSSNGTVINNQKIHNIDVGIYPGDVIMLAGKFELTWNVINRYFPQIQRPTVVRNVRAEKDVDSGRKTVQRQENQQDPKGSRPTEQISHQRQGIAQFASSTTGEKISNYGVENAFSQAEIDQETQKWNWGAFFCTWIWAVYHKLYWPLAIVVVGCIPYLGQVAVLVLSVYLGYTGSEKAWNSGRYDTFEAYKSAQKKWAIAGIVVFILGIIVEAFLVFHLLSIF